MAASILKYAPREDEQTVLTILAQLAIVHAQSRPSTLITTAMAERDGCSCRSCWLPRVTRRSNLSGALLRAKSQYYAALASVQLQGEWGPWLELLGQAVVESCDESISIAEDLLALAERWETGASQLPGTFGTRRLPRFLIGHPVLSVQQAAAGLEHLRARGERGAQQPTRRRHRESGERAPVGRVFQATHVLHRLDQLPAPRQSGG